MHLCPAGWGQAARSGLSGRAGKATPAAGRKEGGPVCHQRSLCLGTGPPPRLKAAVKSGPPGPIPGFDVNPRVTLSSAWPLPTSAFPSVGPTRKPRARAWKGLECWVPTSGRRLRGPGGHGPFQARRVRPPSLRGGGWVTGQVSPLVSEPGGTRGVERGGEGCRRRGGGVHPEDGTQNPNLGPRRELSRRRRPWRRRRTRPGPEGGLRQE